MQYIAMNRFKVLKGAEGAFEDVWLSRETHLDQVPGFVEFHLLKGAGARRPRCSMSHRTPCGRTRTPSRPGRNPKLFPRRPPQRRRQQAALSRSSRVRGFRGHPDGRRYAGPWTRNLKFPRACAGATPRPDALALASRPRRSKSRETEEDGERPCHRQHGFVVEAPERRAEFVSPHRNRLVHHHLRRLTEAGSSRRLDGQPDQRRVNQRSRH